MDVAREAGVSVATVSRVLNSRDHVRADKRMRVVNAMTRLGYVANQQARSLAGGRSQVIGLLLHDLGNGYVGEIIRGIDEEIAAAQYDLMLYTTHQRKIKESTYVGILARGMTDGLLLLLPLYPDAYLETLHREQFPYVVIDHQGFDDFSSTVIAKNRQAAQAATRYLVSLGHRRIGLIAGLPALNSAVERLNGYRAALSAHQIPFDPALVIDGNFQQTGGYHAANQLLDLPLPPTAIFACNDLSAFGAMDAIRNRGLRIPEDISILGFDDIPQAAVMRPALTTVRQPLVEMGRLATRMLLENIDDPALPTRRIELETELVIRESCQPLRRS
jgi:LacI family transcriptional regulator